MNTLLVLAAVSQPVDATIIRRCFDNMSLQFYVERDVKGDLWYGTPAPKASIPWSRLDPKAMDQVCPESASKSKGDSL